MQDYRESKEHGLIEYCWWCNKKTAPLHDRPKVIDADGLLCEQHYQWYTGKINGARSAVVELNQPFKKEPFWKLIYLDVEGHFAFTQAAMDELLALCREEPTLAGRKKILKNLYKKYEHVQSDIPEGYIKK